MSNLDPTSHTPRHSGDTEGTTRFGTLSINSPPTPAAAGAPDGNETLIWLAGNRAPGRRKGLEAPTGPTTPRADSALSEPRPGDPVEAAQKRASILADLRRNASQDPRVKAVFESDPIIVEDPRNGNLVTRQMLSARLDLFDAVLTLIGRMPLTKGARTRTGLTLKAAYAALDDEAQVEWALSEVRLEESKVFQDARSETDLATLSEQLSLELERHDLWAASRTYSMAAHLSVGELRGSAALADLLEMREIAMENSPPKETPSQFRF